MFLYSAISGAVVLLVALLMRLWWDLVEVYIVRNAMDGERRVAHALLPALRLLGRYFFRTVGSFFLVGLLGVSALAFCLYLWKEFVPAHQVWIACSLAGLFLLQPVLAALFVSCCASRFWQRCPAARMVRGGPWSCLPAIRRSDAVTGRGRALRRNLARRSPAEEEEIKPARSKEIPPVWLRSFRRAGSQRLNCVKLAEPTLPPDPALVPRTLRSTESPSLTQSC
jgi:hypothetical protein